MNISIVIPNYNGEKLLKENLPKVVEAIKDYKGGTIEIIISDDASSDGSVAFLQEFLPTIKEKQITGKLVLSKRRTNGGFSKNVNRGVKIATGDVLLLLNSDVIPHKGFLKPLLKHFNEPKVFAVGCMDESIENGKVILRGRGIGKWERGFLLHSAGSLDGQNTLWVSGGSGAFRKSMWDKLGGLNEIFNPFYWEDIDLSYRAQKAGFLTLFEKESTVIHEHSKGTIQTSFKSDNIQKIVYRNQFLFVWLNITDGSLFFNHLLWLPVHLINALRSGDTAFLAGFFAACMKLPNVVAYTQNIRRLFVTSDKEILQRFTK